MLNGVGIIMIVSFYMIYSKSCDFAELKKK